MYEVVSDQMLKDIQGTTEKMIKALKIVTKHLRIKEPLNLMDILQHPEINRDRKSTRLNSSHSAKSRMPSSA